MAHQDCVRSSRSVTAANRVLASPPQGSALGPGGARTSGSGRRTRPGRRGGRDAAGKYPADKEHRQVGASAMRTRGGLREQ